MTSVLTVCLLLLFGVGCIVIGVYLVLGMGFALIVLGIGTLLAAFVTVRGLSIA